MKIIPRGNYLIQLTQTFPLLGDWFPVNAYLIREEDGFTLVDTGFTHNAKPIFEAARSLGAPIRRIALTHAHNDHVASLDELHRLLPQAEVLIGEREARILAGDRSLLPGETGKPNGMACQTRPTRLLRQGDRVGSLEVIAAPGHSVGQMAFFDPRDGSLIAGDAFQIQGGVAVSGTLKLGFPFPAWATWDKETALCTGQRLRALEPARLAVGHGNTLEHPLAAMDRAIAEAERTLARR